MTVSSGALIEGEAQKLYLGDALNSAAVKPELTKQDLAVVLAGGKVDHKTITDVDYSEYLSLGAQSVTFSKETDWKQPYLNLKLDTTNYAYLYKAVFQSGMDTEYIEGKEVTLLGKKYVFSTQDTELTNTTLTLFAAGQTETVSAGSSTTVTVSGSPYVITVVGVASDGSYATIDIDGEAFDVSASGVTYDNYVTKGDLNLYIKAVRAFKFPAESGAVQFFVGSDKLVFDASNVQITQGNSVLQGAWVNFTSVDGNKIYELQVKYTPQEEQLLKSGEGFVDPVFGAFKIKLGGIYPGLDDSSKDYIKIEKSSSTKLKLTFTNKDDKQCAMDVYNFTAWAYGSKPIKVINRNATNPTASAVAVHEGDYFLVTKNKYSTILKYVSTDTTNNLIRLQDMCAGTQFDASTTTKFFYLGSNRYDFEIDTVNELLGVNATDESGGAASAQIPLYTKNGAKVIPQKDNAGNFTITENTFSEAGNDDKSPVSVAITMTKSGSEIGTLDVATTNLVGTQMYTKDDTDYTYAITVAGTYIEEETSNDWLKIYTPKLPTPVYVAVGSDPTFSTASGATAGTVEEAVKIKTPVGKLVSEIDKTAVDRHLVLIGGPCANSLVGDLLNMSTSKPKCSADFTALYPTEGVIKVVSDAFGSGKKALIVAGVDRAKTRSLGAKAMAGTLDYSA
jgi:hypothetical protein